MSRSVLIATCRQEMDTVDRVVGLLKSHAFVPIVINVDDLVTGKSQLNVSISKTGLVVEYDGVVLELGDVKSAWYRRPIAYDWTDDDAAKQMALREEYRESLDIIWRSIAPARWLNSPDCMREADHKLWQLKKAREVGFDTPPTIVATRWQDIIEGLNSPEVIFKPHSARIFIHNQLHVLYTTPVPRDTKSVKKVGKPFPGIWQEFIPKKREWRVTVVGDRVFAAAIMTSNQARADWREFQYADGAVSFHNMTLPPVVQEKCRALMRLLGLGFGAFDIIETHTGEFVFLEVNVEGQFRWLEDSLDLPICKAIADWLMRVALA